MGGDGALDLAAQRPEQPMSLIAGSEEYERYVAPGWESLLLGGVIARDVRAILVDN